MLPSAGHYCRFRMGANREVARPIAVWLLDDYWVYEVWIAGRCIVVGCADARELALRRAELAANLALALIVAGGVGYQLSRVV
jgi:hypothetical protein